MPAQAWQGACRRPLGKRGAAKRRNARLPAQSFRKQAGWSWAGGPGLAVLGWVVLDWRSWAGGPGLGGPGLGGPGLAVLDWQSWAGWSWAGWSWAGWSWAGWSWTGGPGLGGPRLAVPAAQSPGRCSGGAVCAEAAHSTTAEDTTRAHSGADSSQPLPERPDDLGKDPCDPGRCACGLPESRPRRWAATGRDTASESPSADPDPSLTDPEETGVFPTLGSINHPFSAHSPPPRGQLLFTRADLCHSQAGV